MRLSLSAKIGLTLLVNVAMLGALFVGLLAYQARSGFESLLLSPAQERLRTIGSEFSSVVPADRGERLAALERDYGVEVALFDRTGTRVHGALRQVPPPVLREIHRQPQRAFQTGRRNGAHPVFLLRERGLYWAGVHVPMESMEEGRVVRYVLLFITSSVFGNRLFFDWQPWVLAFLVAGGVSLLCWFPLVTGIVRSIHQVRDAAGQIASGQFEVKMAAGRADELGELGTSISKMAENLSRLVHGQRRFLADVAHELCAPLSRVQLSLGILEQRVPPDGQEYLKALERDVRHMSNLVGDLLSFSKGSMRQAQIVEVALRPLVEEVVAREGAGAEVRLLVDPHASAKADVEYLRRALSNLVRNAVAYAGDCGPIEIASEPHGGRVHLQVRDLGPGLPDSELDAVFQPFYRPDPSRDAATGGMGLGLAIVKGCVEACGGGVWCRNRKPKGLEVIVQLQAGENSQ